MSSLMAYILKLSDHFVLIKFSLTLWPGHSIVTAVCVPAQPTQRPRVSSLPITILVIAALVTLLREGPMRSVHSKTHDFLSKISDLVSGTLRMYADPLLYSLSLKCRHLLRIPTVCHNPVCVCTLEEF